MEEKLDRYTREQERNIEEIVRMLKTESSESKSKSWLSRLRGK